MILLLLKWFVIALEWFHSFWAWFSLRVIFSCFWLFWRATVSLFLHEEGATDIKVESVSEWWRTWCFFHVQLLEKNTNQQTSVIQLWTTTNQIIFGRFGPDNKNCFPLKHPHFIHNWIECVLTVINKRSEDTAIYKSSHYSVSDNSGFVLLIKISTFLVRGYEVF